MKKLLFPTCTCLVMWIFAMAAPCSGQKTAPAGADATPLQKENQRIQNVVAWAKQAKPTQKALMFRLYEPVIEGCKKDYPRNLKYAELCQSKADDHAKNGQEKGAKSWADAAKAFVALAKQDQIILHALETGDGNAFGAAVAEIPRLEQQILELTEHPVKRDWYLPGQFGPRPEPKAAVPPAPVPAK